MVTPRGRQPSRPRALVASPSSRVTSAPGMPLRGWMISDPLDLLVHHHADQLGEGNPRLPAEARAGFAGIASGLADVHRPEQLGVLFDLVAVVEPHMGEGFVAELAHRVALAAGDDAVVGDVGLHHQAHGFDAVAGEAPVAARFQGASPEHRSTCAVANTACDHRPLCSAPGCCVHKSRPAAQLPKIEHE